MNGIARITPRSAQATRDLVSDITSIGNVTHRPRLGGHAIFENGVMFAFVNCRGEQFLRTDAATAITFLRLGATKHPQMPYWRIPQTALEDPALLIELAYEASDVAHLAALEDSGATVDFAWSIRPAA